MRPWRMLVKRVSLLWKWRQANQELAEEMAFHEEQLRRELGEQGLQGAALERAVRKSFGSAALAADAAQDTRGWAWVASLGQDAQFAWRYWRRNWGLAMTLVLTLTLTIGASTVISALLYAALWRPLPFPAEEQLYLAQGGGFSMLAPSRLYGERSRAVTAAAYRGGLRMVWSAGGEKGTLTVPTAAVSSGVFPLLGVQPLVGRAMREEDCEPGRPRVVWLSEGFAGRHFAGEPLRTLPGRVLRLNEQDYAIAGVLPEAMRFPEALYGGGEAGGVEGRTQGLSLWIPQVFDPTKVGENWGSGGVETLVRLRAGGRLEAAQSELQEVLTQVRKEFPWPMPAEWGKQAKLVPLRQAFQGEVQQPLSLLFAGVQLLYGLGWLNCASVLFGCGLARLGELRTRTALGAGRGRVMRQLMVEYVLLAGSSMVMGVGLATVGLPVVRGLLPMATEGLGRVVIQWEVLLAQAGAMAAAVVAFGLALAVRLTAGLERPKGRGQGRWLSALVTGQTALAATLLLLSLLAGRSLWQLWQRPTGFAEESVIAGSLQLPASRCQSLAACGAAQEEALEALRRLPAATTVSLAETVPLAGASNLPSFAAAIEDYPRAPSEPAFTLLRIAASPDYFATLGITLRQGRLLRAEDSVAGNRVAVVSASTAARYWPKGDAVGKRVRPVWMREWVTIVGVVSDVAQSSLAGDPAWAEGLVYTALAQGDTAGEPVRKLNFLVRSQNPAATLAAAGETLRRLLPGVPVEEIRSMAVQRRQSVGTNRGVAILLGLFAGLSLLLAGLGIYGVLSRRLESSRREFGIRMALGASPMGVASAILRQAVGLCLAGVVLGGAAYFAVVQGLRRVGEPAIALPAGGFGVGEWNANVLLATAATLVLLSVAAAVLPAVRAAMVDPAGNLRNP